MLPHNMVQVNFMDPAMKHQAYMPVPEYRDDENGRKTTEVPVSETSNAGCPRPSTAPVAYTYDGNASVSAIPSGNANGSPYWQGVSGNDGNNSNNLVTMYNQTTYHHHHHPMMRAKRNGPPSRSHQNNSSSLKKESEERQGSVRTRVNSSEESSNFQQEADQPMLRSEGQEQKSSKEFNKKDLTEINDFVEKRREITEDVTSQNIDRTMLGSHRKPSAPASVDTQEMRTSPRAQGSSSAKRPRSTSPSPAESSDEIHNLGSVPFDERSHEGHGKSSISQSLHHGYHSRRDNGRREKGESRRHDKKRRIEYRREADPASPQHDRIDRGKEREALDVVKGKAEEDRITIRMRSSSSRETSSSATRAKRYENALRVFGSLSASFWSTDSNFTITSHFGPRVNLFLAGVPDVGTSLTGSSCASEWGELKERYVSAQKGHRVERAFAKGGKHYMEVLAPLRDEQEKVVGVSGMLLQLMDPSIFSKVRISN